jgi:hypothetical protein
VTIRRTIGFGATGAGWFFLALAAVETVLLFYYRPTLEYVEAGGRPRPIPDWLTGELVGIVFATLLVVTGGSLLWGGKRRRRR